MPVDQESVRNPDARWVLESDHRQAMSLGIGGKYGIRRRPAGHTEFERHSQMQGMIVGERYVRRTEASRP